MSGFVGAMTSNGSYISRGLVQYLDAQSYTSGSSWSAIVGGSATLYNTPTHTSTGANYMTFAPASSQYATIPNLGSLGTWTIEAWFATNASIAATIMAIVTSTAGTSDTYPINFCLGQGRATNNYNIAAGYWNSSTNWQNAAGFMPTQGTWYQSVGTYDGSTITQYTNGSSIATQAATGITGETTQPIRIASRWDDQSQSLDFFPGSISIIRIYNRALTSGEVFQNYTAQRGRHSI